MNRFFKPGSHGFLIKRLQTALSISPDGEYGPKTAAAVRVLQSARLNLSSAPAGCAGAAEFRDAGLPWPSEFERAMNLVSCFEGTSFGDCNRRDIDGAGLTMGIAGFTTKHGEVQELLAQFIAQQPTALDALSPDMQNRLLSLFNRRATAAQWKALFYDQNGNVFQSWQKVLKSWGDTATMQGLQLEMACVKFWEPAVTAAQVLGFPTLHGYTFFLDVAVQNGGWRNSHLVLAKRMLDWHGNDTPKALAAAARAVSACSKLEWRNDVLSRKMAIATTRGVVHGREYDLSKYALVD